MIPFPSMVSSVRASGSTTVGLAVTHSYLTGIQTLLTASVTRQRYTAAMATTAAVVATHRLRADQMAQMVPIQVERVGQARAEAAAVEVIHLQLGRCRLCLLRVPLQWQRL